MCQGAPYPRRGVGVKTMGLILIKNLRLIGSVMTPAITDFRKEVKISLPLLDIEMYRYAGKEKMPRFYNYKISFFIKIGPNFVPTPLYIIDLELRNKAHT